MSFWWFEIVPTSWKCYTGVSSDFDAVNLQTRIVTIEGQMDQTKYESCTINSITKANELPIELKIWSGAPYQPDKLSEFLPKNLPGFYEAPKCHFGRLSYNPEDAMFHHSEGLQVLAQVPKELFDDLWSWFKTGGDLVDSIHLEAFGNQLTCHHGHDSVSWTWETGEHGQLLLAKIGVRFEHLGPRRIL